jgi:molybdopterin-guanine dinucleotide biosynthesis protein A
MGIHQKHAPLIKPQIGQFGRNELAILGTPCSHIKKLAYDTIQSLKEEWNIAYIDADHKNDNDPGNSGLAGSLDSGASVDFLDKITYLQINKTRNENPFQLKKSFSDQDLVIVNGNHFVADRQILVIDPKKDLQKKLDKITNVIMILLKEPETDVPEYIRNHIPDFDNTPVFNFDDSKNIVDRIKLLLNSNKPVLKGLVLAGGKSVRMDQDKGLIDYHGLPQREFAAQLLSTYCEEVYISCRPDQAESIEGNFKALPDTFDGLGPFGGIVSAFRTDPNAAWLVVACDLPYLDETTIDYLVSNRNRSKVATSFWDTDHQFPEPLITIWEPKAYGEMLFFLSMGHSCPRKVLINSNTEVLEAPDNHALTNVNNPEEMKAVLASVKNDKSSVKNDK